MPVLSLIGGTTLEHKFANSMSKPFIVQLAPVLTVRVFFVLVMLQLAIISSNPGNLEWLNDIHHQLTLLVSAQESLQLGWQFHLVVLVFVEHDVLEVEDLGGGLGWDVS
jgi:hypothetical protein